MTKRSNINKDKKKPKSNAQIAIPINIDEAVNHINELVGNKLYETAIAVGNYVLKTFFNDNINEIRSKNPHKLLSFKTLCDRADLKIHPKHLNQMVQVAAQEKILLAGKANELGYSLKVELLKIHDDKLRIETAKKWIAKPITIAEAKKYIASLGESGPAVSDLIPLNSFIIDQLKTISEWTENDVLDGMLKGLSINKIKKIKDHIDAFLEKYEPVKTKLSAFKNRVDPIYIAKKDELDAKLAAPQKKRGRPAKTKNNPSDVKHS